VGSLKAIANKLHCRGGLHKLQQRPVGLRLSTLQAPASKLHCRGGLHNGGLRVRSYCCRKQVLSIKKRFLEMSPNAMSFQMHDVNKKKREKSFQYELRKCPNGNHGLISSFLLLNDSLMNEIRKHTKMR
jgi:hypothetical protein